MSKLKENTFSEEDAEITDWDLADDFGSEEEMRIFLELVFLDDNIEIILDSINAVARAKGNKEIARQVDSLQNKNPSSEIINQMLNSIGFSWNNQKMAII